MTDSDASQEGPMTDPVTGALPRALLRPRLDGLLARTAAAGGRCAVFLFDVDFFKSVNDAYGHLRGDRVLRELADTVKGSIRGTDTLFRYGGDEFVVVLPETDRTEALRCALRLAEEIRRHEFDGEPPLHLSISLGVAVHPEDGTGTEALLSCADRRNYLAKRRGRDSVVGDDVEPDGESAFSRLWERDVELRTVHEFLTRVQADGVGALSVTGEPGAGHTRFLAETATIATLRGFTVVPVRPEPQPLPVLPPETRPGGAARAVLLLADLDAVTRVPEAVAAARASHPAVLGLVYATTGRAAHRASTGQGGVPKGPGAGADATELPVVAKTELKPWSAATVRVWLRNALRGEPSRTLLNWITAESGGLPSAVVRALARLKARHGLVPATNGGWTVSTAVLGRPTRAALPTPLTAFIGREHDRDRVVGMLGGARLVTLVGPGGIGKTRLSLAVATMVAERFDEGAVFVPLADTTDGDQVVSVIAKTLRVAEAPGEPLLDAVMTHLTEASLLLVLDNFEQVVDAAPVITTMLAAAPRVTALVTSRERLSVYGEQIYPVPPLPLPDLATLPTGAERVPWALATSPAISLFEQRARAADPGFRLTTENLPAVIELCRRLDGLPLAIELAAARTDRWPPDQLLHRLAGHLDPGGPGPRDLPERQQTLRGAIEWSYDLLTPDEQSLFETLAVFAGGAGTAAVRAVAIGPAGLPSGPPGQAGLPARLDLLVGKNLLVAEVDSDGADRYRLLETIRVYAAGRLAERPDAGDVHDRHAAYFVEFAERCGDGMTGPDQADWTERLERDYDNLRAALGWLTGHGEMVPAARLCLGLWRYWRNGANLTEGRDWLARVLSAPDPLPTGLHARVLYAAAVLAAGQDDHSAAADLAAHSLRLADAAGDRATTAQAHNALGIAAIEAGRYDRAADHFQHSLFICQELDQPQGTAIALGNLTKVALRRGDLAAADEYTRRCLELERTAGNTRGIVMALEAVGQIRLAQGDITAARGALTESLQLSRTLGDVFGEATALHGLGLAAQIEGHHDDALQLLVGALARRHEVGDREDLAVSLDRVAGLTLTTDPALAARLLAAAFELRQRHRLPDPPESETGREATLALVRRLLDDRTLAAAWSVGRTTPLDRVVDQVLDLVSKPS